MHRRIGSLAVVLAALVAASGANAASPHGHTIRDSPELWATINVCDTIAEPNAIGVRGSMPGSGRRAERMFMRFQVQYFWAVDRKWHNISKGGDSGFVSVGRATFAARQSGRMFTFAPPAGGSWQLRGVVTFEWRVGKEVVRRVREHTTAGHDADDADPPGYSADTCTIS